MLTKTANLAKVGILTKFSKVVDEMIRVNNLTQLEGPRNVGEFGENGEGGESGDFVMLTKFCCRQNYE